MHIDCQSCPGRPLACDGCMVQVLFGPPSSANITSEGGASVTESGPDPIEEISQAIDCFVDAAMTSRSAALSARRGISAGRGASTGVVTPIRRAG